MPRIATAATLIFIFGLSAAYAFVTWRFISVFPDCFVRSMTEVFMVDSPRLSYIVFQIPSIALDYLGRNAYTDIPLKMATQGLLLSFYPLAIMVAIWRVLERGGRGELVPMFLVAVWIFAVPAMAPSFSGSQQGFLFMLLTLAVQMTTLTMDGYYRKPTLFTALFLFSSFFYPPATVVGCLTLLLHWRGLGARAQWGYYLIGGVGLANAGYIVAIWAVGLREIYYRSLDAIAFSWQTSLFAYMVVGLTYAAALTIDGPLRARVKAALIPLAAALAGYYVYRTWDRELLTAQYEYRVYIFTGGFLFLWPALWGRPRYDRKLDLAFLTVTLAVALTFDFRGSFLHGESIAKIHALASTMTRKCETFSIRREDLAITPIEIHPAAFVTSDFKNGGRIPFAAGAHRYHLPEFFKAFCETRKLPP